MSAADRQGLDTLQVELVWLLLSLGVCILVGCALTAIGAGLTGLRSRAAARLRARRHRPDTTFYVGRREVGRVVVCRVDRDGVRPLYTSSPPPGGWAQIGRPLARALAADALVTGVAGPGPSRLAQHLGELPADGFVLERRAVRALARPAGTWRWMSDRRAAAPHRLPRAPRAGSHSPSAASASMPPRTNRRT